jgi:hypothetical protein
MPRIPHTPSPTGRSGSAPVVYLRASEARGHVPDDVFVSGVSCQATSEECTTQTNAHVRVCTLLEACTTALGLVCNVRTVLNAGEGRGGRDTLQPYAQIVRRVSA